MIQARRSNRVRIRAPGSVTTGLGAKWDVELDDLSPSGCRVEDPRHGLKLGEHVRLLIAGTGPHRAEVAWRQNDRVGLEFFQPIAEKTFELLAKEDWGGARAADKGNSGGSTVRRVV